MSVISFTWALFTVLYFSNISCIKSQNARYLLSDESNRRLPEGVKIKIFSMKFSVREMITKYTRSFRIDHVYGADPFIAEAIIGKQNELTIQDCMDLNEVFWNHQDEMNKMDEDSMNQQLKEIVAQITTIRIEQLISDDAEQIILTPLGRPGRSAIDATFLQKKHILDYLNIRFTVSIPDSCITLHVNNIGFNENMLSVFKFGDKSQLQRFYMYWSQYTSLDYENFGKYFPQNIRENNELDIHVSSSTQLQGVVDLKKLGFEKLRHFGIGGTGIERVINIPNTVTLIDAGHSKLRSREQLRMTDGSEYAGDVYF